MNPSCPTPQRLLCLLIEIARRSLFQAQPAAMGVLAVTFFTTEARAASSSWINQAGSTYTVTANWQGGNVPGSNSTTTSTDIAIFGMTLTANITVNVDANRNLGGITFSPNNTNFRFLLQGGNILLSNGGVIRQETPWIQAHNTQSLRISTVFLSRPITTPSGLARV